MIVGARNLWALEVVAGVENGLRERVAFHNIESGVKEALETLVIKGSMQDSEVRIRL